MPVQTDTTIQFSSLKIGSYDYEIRLGREFFERFENEEIADGDVLAAVHVERKERLILFNIVLKGTITMLCDRCLGEMTLPVEGSHLLTVKVSDREEQASEDEDVVFLPEKECRIDLAQWLYEYVAIEIPLSHCHPDDADGQPTCDPAMLSLLEEYHGDTRDNAESDDTEEIDPRWAALRGLKDE